jgi:NADH:ubiquinone oxidoreductase subunit
MERIQIVGLLNFLGVQSPAHIKLLTFFSGAKYIGEDQFGNKYYSASPRKGYKRNRRWVIYKGQPEASKVPPEWHGWLHYQTDVVPSENEKSFRRPWQQPHQPNQTGTDQAYRPPGHILSGGKRDKATGDYKPWTPAEK